MLELPFLRGLPVKTSIFIAFAPSCAAACAKLFGNKTAGLASPVPKTANKPFFINILLSILLSFGFYP